MILNKDNALKIAEFLLQIKAVQLKPDDPYTWSSGLKAPIYCDNRVTLSYPNIRTYIRQYFAEDIVQQFGQPEVIAGVATGGIPHGTLVAQALGLPFIYVRSGSKGHGRQNLIEGVVNEGQNVVVVEDLISTGQSAMNAVGALRDSGMNVKGLAAIFTYGFKKSEEAFEAAQCPFITLSNYDFLIDQAVESGYINDIQRNTLRSWREAPEEWSDKNQ